ncbi:MAG: LicD family protein [Prevotella sp.]|nr:LicD family protein [Prevotella sp.]
MKRIKDYLERRYYQFMRLIVGRKRRDEMLRRKEMKYNSDLVNTYGPEALRVFTEIVSTENSSYWLFWGTLLGAYREHAFIKLDEDVDVGMFSSDMTTSLIEKMETHGFKCLHVIVDKDLKGEIHFAFDYKGIKFDIYSFSENPDKKNYTVFMPIPYNYRRSGFAMRTDIWEEVHIIVPMWKNINQILFEGVSTFIPSNVDEILKILYGVNYMTPIPGYKANDEYTENKIHLDPQENYACLMSSETFKMLKHHISFLD